jgi:hypothetical protein
MEEDWKQNLLTLKTWKLEKQLLLLGRRGSSVTVFWKTLSPSVAQAGLELEIFLPPPREFWDYR